MRIVEPIKMRELTLKKKITTFLPPILDYPPIFFDSQPNPERVTYVRKQLTFFKLPSHLNKLDLCGLLLTQYLSGSGQRSAKVSLSQACLGVRAI